MRTQNPYLLLSCLLVLSISSAHADVAIGNAAGTKTAMAPTTAAPETPTEDVMQLQAEVSFIQFDNKVTEQLNNLMDVSLKQNPEMEKLNKADKHYSKRSQRAIKQSKDAAQFLLCYQGFAPSSNAADIMLGEKLKLNNRNAVQYARQLVIDDTHLKLMQATMQISLGLGERNSERAAKAIQSGKDKLQALVGAEEAENTVKLLTSWSKDLQIPKTAFEAPLWDIDEQNDKLKLAIDGAVNSDKVVEDVHKSLHKYNKQSPVKRASGHVVESVLGAAALCPNVIGPAAEGSLCLFQLATGGSEQSKLTKSIYLGKQQDSRISSIKEEAHLALANYQLAVATGNKPLLAFAQLQVHKIAGKKVAQEIFGDLVVSVDDPKLPEADTSHLPETKNNG